MYERDRVFSVVGFIVLFTLLGLSPAFAQGEQSAIEQKLKAVAPGEAVEVMQAAVEYVNQNILGTPFDQYSDHPAVSIKIDPVGILSSSFSTPSKAVPAKVRSLAKRLAAALGTEVSSSVRAEAYGVFMATSVPKVQGAEARVEVRRLTKIGGGRFGIRRIRLKLERRADGQWRVTTKFAPMFIDGSYDVGREEAEPDAQGVYSFAEVEVKPQLPGSGLPWVYKAPQYPEAARADGVKGAVELQFVVGSDGKTCDVTVLRSPHPALTEEAKRILRNKRFEPGRQGGKAVPVRMSMSVLFGYKIENLRIDGSR